MKNMEGFTLIELMVVISIIGILAAIAIPQFSEYRARSFICEGYSLVSPIRYDIQDYVDATGVLPDDNAMAGLADPEQIRGKYVEQIRVDKGVVTVLFNDSQPSLEDSYFKLIPEVNQENPTGPLVWNKKTNEDEESSQEATDPESTGTSKKRKKL